MNPNKTVTAEEAMMMNRHQRRALGKLNKVKIPGINVPAKSQKYESIKL